MMEKTVVYSKETGEPPVPITARLRWNADGSILPELYWMDDICLKVIRVYECTPLAFLRQKGCGICFRTLAEVVETSETCTDFLHTRHETYLYFNHGMFCGMDIIDGRYGHPGKQYVPVVLDVFPDAGYELLYFWVDGMRYMVEKTLSVEFKGSYKAGGIGLRHEVMARLVNPHDDEDPDYVSVRRPAALFLELNKWFVKRRFSTCQK